MIPGIVSDYIVIIFISMYCIEGRYINIITKIDSNHHKNSLQT